MFDEIASKTVHKDKEGDQQRKRSKKLNEVKPVKNINKNPQSFLEIIPVQTEVLPSQKLQDHAYAWEKPSGSQRNCKNQLSHPCLSHIEQECQGSLIQGKIHIQQN